MEETPSDMVTTKQEKNNRDKFFQSIVKTTMNNDETHSALAEKTLERNSRTHQMVHHSTDLWFTTNWNQREVYTREEVNIELYNKMVKNMKRSLGKLM